MIAGEAFCAAPSLTSLGAIRFHILRPLTVKEPTAVRSEVLLSGTAWENCGSSAKMGVARPRLSHTWGFPGA